MPAMKIWAQLTYRFEDMTEMINGAFTKDLGEHLSSAMGRQHETLHKINQELEKIFHMLHKNFTTIKSRIPFLRSSPFQAQDHQAKSQDQQGRLSCASIHGSRFETPPFTHVTLQALLDQEFVPKTPEADLDSSDMLNILQGSLAWPIHTRQAHGYYGGVLER
jgi:hypothetical protein